MLAQAHADHGVPGPRGAAQVAEQFGHRVDGAQRQHAGQIPAGVTLAVQPSPAAEPRREQGGEAYRHHHHQVAAGQVELEQIGCDGGHPEHHERGLDDALVLDRAVADGGRIPAAGPSQREHPDDHQRRRQRHQGHQTPVDGTVRADRREPGEMHDLLGLLVAAQVVHLTRFPPVGADGAIARSLVPLVALTATLVLVWMLALTWSGSRDPTTIGYGAVEYQRVIQATFMVFGVAAIASYLLKFDLPRSYLMVMMPVGLAALLAARFGCRRWLHRQRDTGRYLSRVLALGTIDTVTELLRDLRRAPRAGYTVIGVCLGEHQPSGDTAGDTPRQIDGVPVLGDLNTVAEIVRSCGADTVAVTSIAAFGPSEVRQLSSDLEDTPARLL